MPKSTDVVLHPCRICGVRPTLAHVSPPVARPAHYAVECDCAVAVTSQYPDLAVDFWQKIMEPTTELAAASSVKGTAPGFDLDESLEPAGSAERWRVVLGIWANGMPPAEWTDTRLSEIGKFVATFAMSSSPSEFGFSDATTMQGKVGFERDGNSVHFTATVDVCAPENSDGGLFKEDACQLALAYWEGATRKIGSMEPIFPLLLEDGLPSVVSACPA